MNIVSNWRVTYKKYSVKALGMLTLLQGSLQVVPQTWLQAPLPFAPQYTFTTVLMALSAAVAILGLFGAYIDQGIGTEPPAP